MWGCFNHLYFSRPIKNRPAVERALQISTSKPVVGAWRWDSQCGTAPECLYFRPRHYWRPHTRVSFTAHLNGLEAEPGVYGHHTLTQTFTIGTSLIAVVSTAHHYLNVFRNGKKFAHWPISTGRPGDDTPDGTYLTIEKANPVDMVGPGYNIEVPLSVRITWSGDYLHDAFWSVGERDPQTSATAASTCRRLTPRSTTGWRVRATREDHGQPTGRDLGQRLDHVVPALESVGARQRAAPGSPGGPEWQHVRQPSPSPPPPAQHHSEGRTPGRSPEPDVAAI